MDIPEGRRGEAPRYKARKGTYFKEFFMAVWVIDKHKKSLMPSSEKRARLLLDRGRAVVHRRVPFTIRLKDRNSESCETQPVRIKIDPGSKTTGIALVRESTDCGGSQHVLSLIDVQHRGKAIRDALTQRRGFRRRRRTQNLRHRPVRFDNRTKPKGWLAPSLQHRVDTTMAWVDRIRRCVPVASVDQERVRFDTQAMEFPGISDIQYQQGTLMGTEVREYLLHRHSHTCAYCAGGTGDPVLEIEHVVPRSRGGSDRVANLVIACSTCNDEKGNQTAGEWTASIQGQSALANGIRRRAERIHAGQRPALSDAAAVNSTRWALYNRLRGTGLPVYASTGGRTKWNRQQLGVPKTHALDAACVGSVKTLEHWCAPTLSVKATGRGSYQRTRLTRYGFPRGYLMRRKQVRGFQTGDFVQAEVPAGKKAGVHQGRVAVRVSGSFNLQTPQGVVQGISYRHCRRLQRADGYGYSFTPKPEEKRAEAR